MASADLSQPRKERPETEARPLPQENDYLDLKAAPALQNLRYERAHLVKMAASYWDSTQRKHWQFTKDRLAEMRQSLEDEDPGLVQMFPLPSTRHLNIYFNQRASNPPMDPLPRPT